MHIFSNLDPLPLDQSRKNQGNIREKSGKNQGNIRDWLCLENVSEKLRNLVSAKCNQVNGQGKMFLFVSSIN